MIKIGSVIQFGGYDWRVLDIQDDKALLLSDKILGSESYHSYTHITWENSNIRKYLNNKFLSELSQSDVSRIATSDIVNNDNPWYGVEGGATTSDKVFLLSLDELCNYFGSNKKLSKRPAPSYSERKWYSKGFRTWNDETKELVIKDGYPTRASWIHDRNNSKRIAHEASGRALSWWLRTLGRDGSSAIYVYSDGSIKVNGYRVNNVFNCIRPALWLKL